MGIQRICSEKTRSFSVSTTDAYVALCSRITGCVFLVTIGTFSPFNCVFVVLSVLSAAGDYTGINVLFFYKYKKEKMSCFATPERQGIHRERGGEPSGRENKETSPTDNWLLIQFVPYFQEEIKWGTTTTQAQLLCMLSSFFGGGGNTLSLKRHRCNHLSVHNWEQSFWGQRL